VHPQPSRVWGPPGDALAQRSCTARLPQSVPQPRPALPRNQICPHSACVLLARRVLWGSFWVLKEIHH
jgi:hypothetical protein